MREPLYALRFRYVKPAKTLIKTEQKLAEIFLYTPGSPRSNRKNGKLKSSLALSARVPVNIFRRFLIETGWEEKNGLLLTSREEPYYRAVVLAAILQCTRDRYLMEEMCRVVRDMPYVDLKFWSRVFIQAFENRNWRRDLYKPVRALKKVYEYV